MQHVIVLLCVFFQVKTQGCSQAIISMVRVRVLAFLGWWGLRTRASRLRQVCVCSSVFSRQANCKIERNKVKRNWEELWLFYNYLIRRRWLQKDKLLSSAWCTSSPPIRSPIQHQYDAGPRFSAPRTLFSFWLLAAAAD